MSGDARLVTGGMRAILYVAAGLVFAVGVPLTLLPAETDRFFAWTIASPLTAAFLGGSYWAACVLELLAARRREWENARVAVPAVIAFTGLTFLVTLIHIDRFHFDAPEAGTVAGTWLWLAVYAIVPVAMSVLILRQLRTPGHDLPPTAPLERWKLASMAGISAVMFAAGALLLVAPDDTKGIWPWALTPLTARAVGAWLIGLAIASAHAAREADAVRMQPLAWGSIVFVALQAIALIRYGDEMDWSSVGAVVYVAVLAAIGATGLATRPWRHRRAAADQPATAASLTRSPSRGSGTPRSQRSSADGETSSQR
jgi:hypothetical protein